MIIDFSKSHATTFRPGQCRINLRYHHVGGSNPSPITCEDPNIIKDPTFQDLRGYLEAIFEGISNLPVGMLEYLSDHPNPISIHNVFSESIQPKKKVTCFYDPSESCVRIALIQDTGREEGSTDPRYLPLQKKSVLFMLFYAAAYNMFNHQYAQSRYLQYPTDSVAYKRYTLWKNEILEFKTSFYIDYKTDIETFGYPKDTEFVLPPINDPDFQSNLTNMLSLMISYFFSNNRGKIFAMQRHLPHSMVTMLMFLKTLDYQARTHYKLIMNNREEVLAISAQRSPLV